jgi:hypothetical protein
MFVARHMKPSLDISSISFELEAVRNERGALSLPLAKPIPAVSHLQRIHGTARVVSSNLGVLITDEEVAELGRQVEQRCPIASMVVYSGCELDVKWVVIQAQKE